MRTGPFFLDKNTQYLDVAHQKAPRAPDRPKRPRRGKRGLQKLEAGTLIP